LYYEYTVQMTRGLTAIALLFFGHASFVYIIQRPLHSELKITVECGVHAAVNAVHNTTNSSQKYTFGVVPKPSISPNIFRPVMQLARRGPSTDQYHFNVTTLLLNGGSYCFSGKFHLGIPRNLINCESINVII
jgi:hypothetical protein